MSVKMRGIRQLEKKLAALAKVGGRRAQRKAVRAGTAELLKAIKAATPVDKGLLRKAQASKVFGRGLSLGGVVGADVAKLEAAQAEGRPSNIDWLVEEGHVAPDGTFIPPSGYMRRAAAEAMPAAEATYARVLAQEIEREASR